MNDRSGDILVENGIVLTVDLNDTRIENGAVLIKDGVIVSMGTMDEMNDVSAEIVIDAEKCIIMPGLVNTHTHLPMSLFRGMADDLELMTWLNEYIFPAEARSINPETVKLGSQISCAEMLLSGTTTFCDGYFYEDEIAETVFDTGMRAVLAQGVIDYPAPGVPDPSGNIKNALEYVARWKGRSSVIYPSIFCHSPYTCSDKTLVNAKKTASDAGVLFQIHMAETQGELEQIKKEHGKSPVQYLDQLGLLDPETLLAHAVWVDEHDIEIIAGSGAAISHNPESNMKLAAGVAPVPEYIQKGIRVGLGTDGSASNNNLDLFSEMDSAAKLHKVHKLDPVVMDALTVLKMATRHGADAIGLESIIGSLEVGKKADIILVDTNKPHLIPMYNPVSHLVYSAGGADVRDVIIDGRVVVRNRQILTMDLEDIFSRAKGFENDLKRGCFSNDSRRKQCDLTNSR